MKFENSTYQQPLSMIGLGGGATSLSRGSAAGQNYWPFDTDKIIMPTKSPVYTFGEKTARTSLLPTTGFYMKPDGTAMFTMQIDNKIRRHTMSTAWDLTTASQDQVTPARLSTSVGIGTTTGGTNAETLRGLEFKPDGTKVYYADTDYIYEYELSTAWDLTTIASSPTNSKHPGHSSTRTITSFKFKPNGSRLYVTTCALEDGQTYSNDGVFPKNGTYVPYYSGSGDSDIRQFNNYSGSDYYWQINYYGLNTTYNTFSGGVVGLCFNTQNNNGTGGGENLYLIVNDGGTLQYWHFPLSGSWNIGTISSGTRGYLYNFEYYAFGLGLNPTWYDPTEGSDDGTDYGNTLTGTKLYIPSWNRRISLEQTENTGSGSPIYGQYQNSNNKYVFGIPSYSGGGWWLIEQDSSYTNFFSPNANSSTNPSSGGFNENSLECFTFKPDGTKVYINHVYAGSYSQILQYDMNTAWDLRTIDSTSKVTVSSYNSINEFKSANGDVQYYTYMRWDSTGTRLLCGPGRSGGYYQCIFAVLNFSNAYDPSSYTSGNRFQLSYGTIPTSNPVTGCVSLDGKHMYAFVRSGNINRIYQFSTSTAFNYYAASAAGTYDIPDYINRMEISPDGTQMITVCDRIYVGPTVNYDIKPIPAEISSYTLSTPFDISTATPDNKTTVIGALNIPFLDHRYYNDSEFNFHIVSNGEGAAENGFYIFHTNSGMWGYKLEVR